jgi:transposase
MHNHIIEMVNKASAHGVTPRQSATMNILHNVNKLSIRQIHEKFPKFSLSTVFRHAIHKLQITFPKRSGRPRKVTERDERELIRVLKKLRKTDGSLTSKKSK